MTIIIFFFINNHGNSAHNCETLQILRFGFSKQKKVYIFSVYRAPDVVKYVTNLMRVLSEEIHDKFDKVKLDIV